MLGGYIAASRELCDFVRSFASGFIFTTALPPVLAAGALGKHRASCAAPRSCAPATRSGWPKCAVRWRRARIPMLDNPSHIVPVMVRDAALCKRISDELLDRDALYVQPINYPTVARGTERLRITPTPLHTDADVEHLAASLARIWHEMGLPRAA